MIRSITRAAKTRALNKRFAAQAAELFAATADLAKANGTITNLRDDAAERAAELSRTKALAEDRGQSIDAFKEEVLQLQIQAAEMRGYISRVLEDDTVRELGAEKMQEGTLTDGERSIHIGALQQDDRARSQPRRSVRLGPSAINPPCIMADSAFSGDFSHRGASYISREPARPKHWTRR